MNEHKKNIFTWIALVLLTILSWKFSESLAGKAGLVAIILASIVKYFGVSLQFLELKKAHTFWQVGLLGFLLFFYLVIFFLI